MRYTKLVLFMRFRSQRWFTTPSTIRRLLRIPSFIKSLLNLDCTSPMHSSCTFPISVKYDSSHFLLQGQVSPYFLCCFRAHPIPYPVNWGMYLPAIDS